MLHMGVSSSYDIQHYLFEILIIILWMDLVVFYHGTVRILVMKHMLHCLECHIERCLILFKVNIDETFWMDVFCY